MIYFGLWWSFIIKMHQTWSNILRMMVVFCFRNRPHLEKHIYDPENNIMNYRNILVQAWPILYLTFVGCNYRTQSAALSFEKYILIEVIKNGICLAGCKQTKFSFFVKRTPPPLLQKEKEKEKTPSSSKWLEQPPDRLVRRK